MTNIAAAIGPAQIERLDDLARKRPIAYIYRTLLRGRAVEFQQTGADVRASEWMVTLLLPRGADATLMADWRGATSHSRPVFHCAHQLPSTPAAGAFPCRCSERIAARGISLPSYPALRERSGHRAHLQHANRRRSGTGLESERGAAANRRAPDQDTP